MSWRATRFFVLIGLTWASGIGAPSYAGYGQSIARALLPTLIRHVVRSVSSTEPAPPRSRGVRATQSYSTSRSSSLPRNHATSPAHYDQDPDAQATQRNSTRAPGSDYWTPKPASAYRADSAEDSVNQDDSVVGLFNNGAAGSCSFEQLLEAKVIEYQPMHGGIRARRDKINYVILHSTETAHPADARRVIQSWGNRGAQHPGAQFVVDRDGTIYSTVSNPDLVTSHIDTGKALSGYSNDNSIGIEIVRAGSQKYTRPQLLSLERLVCYLQSYYRIPDRNVTTHHHVQPSDRSDPVGFDMDSFEIAEARLRENGTAPVIAKSDYSYPWQYNPPSGPASRHTRALSQKAGDTAALPKPAPNFQANSDDLPPLAPNRI